MQIKFVKEPGSTGTQAKTMAEKNGKRTGLPALFQGGNRVFAWPLRRALRTPPFAFLPARVGAGGTEFVVCLGTGAGRDAGGSLVETGMKRDREGRVGETCPPSGRVVRTKRRDLAIEEDNMTAPRRTWELHAWKPPSPSFPFAARCYIHLIPIHPYS